jgi:MFS family permease
MRHVRLNMNRWILLCVRSSACAVAAGAPTITELWQARGMTKGQFYLLEIFFAIALMVLEIATGRFADRYGKVLTLVLGYGAQAAGSLVYAFATSFHDFIVGEAVFALGLALTSGTDEALLFQSNKALDREDSHQQWWTTSIGLGFLTMGVCSITGAWLATKDLTLPYIFGAGGGLVAALLCLLMVEPSASNTQETSPAKGTLGEAVTVVLLSSRALRWMILAPGFIVSINQTYLWMYPEYLKDCDITTSGRGYVFAIFNLVAGASALCLRRIENDAVSMRVVFAMLLGLAASTCGLLTLVGSFAWVILLPQQVVRSVSGILFSQTINQAIPDAVRVTALSIRNALRVTVYIAVLTPWWLGVDALGRNGMFLVNLLMLTAATLIFWITYPGSESV